MQIIDLEYLIYDADISSHCKIHLFEEKQEEKIREHSYISRILSF